MVRKWQNVNYFVSSFSFVALPAEWVGKQKGSVLPNFICKSYYRAPPNRGIFLGITTESSLLLQQQRGERERESESDSIALVCPLGNHGATAAAGARRKCTGGEI
jgi:hypothetical protein